MSNSKLEIKIGELKFSGEGNEEWLSQQLDKLIEKLPEITSIKPVVSKQPAKTTSKPNPEKTPKSTSDLPASLSSFLKDKSATTSQAKKFLATAVYLHKKGQDRISTGEVNTALKDARQNKLGNTSDCLNQQVKKGFCVKDGKQFYVTQKGEESIG